MNKITNPSLLLNLPYHLECGIKDFKNSCFDCSVCLQSFCDWMQSKRHVCKGTNGKTNTLFETCDYCEGQMDVIRQIQLLRAEFESIRKSEKSYFRRHIAPLGTSVPIIYGLYKDHKCLPEPNRREQFTPRVLQDTFDCGICYDSFLALYNFSGEKGILMGHNCLTFLCSLCSFLRLFWSKYSTISRSCYQLILDNYFKEERNLSQNIKLDLIRPIVNEPGEDLNASSIPGLGKWKFSTLQIELFTNLKGIRDIIDSKIGDFKVEVANSRYLNVIVEGSIGAGKSLLLDQLKNLDVDGKIEFYQEPVSQWINFENTNLLQKFYDAPKKNAFALQSFINLTKLRQFLEKPNKAIKVFERSLASSQECFMPILAKKKLVPPHEAGILSAWAKTLNSSFADALAIDYIIYLRTDPAKCYERIQLRGRPEETNVTLDYLQELHDSHEAWISDLEKQLSGPKVLTIDVSKDVEFLKPIYAQVYQDLVSKER